MNYLKLINTFWDMKRERQDFTAQIHSLYFTLLFFANKFEWKEFSLYREDVTGLAEISNNTYYSARETLKEAGLITYKEGSSKRNKCLFKILQVYQIKDTERTVANTLANTVRDTVPNTAANTARDTIHNKPINLKTYKPINNSNSTSLFSNSENNISDPLPEKEKPKEKSCAKKEKVKEHLFRDSPYFDLQKFIAAFDAKQYAAVDLVFYYNAVLDWSEANAKTKVDWIATCRGFMRRDSQNKILKMIKAGPSQGTGHAAQRLNTGMNVMNAFDFNEDGSLKVA